MKKKIIGLLLTCVLILTVCFPAAAEVVEEYNGVTSEELQDALESFHNQFMSYGDQELDEIEESFENAEMPEMARCYQEARKVKDKLTDAEVTGFQMETVEEQDAVLRLTLTLDSEKNGEYQLKLLLDDSLQSIVSFSYEPVHHATTGELMAKAGLNTLLGMGIVFLVLILISVLISLFRFLPGSGAKKTAPALAAPAVEETITAVPAVSETDDKELVAVITASVAAAMGTKNTDGFVVRSIKKRKW